MSEDDEPLLARPTHDFVRSRAELISELYQLLDEQTDVHRRGG